MKVVAFGEIMLRLTPPGFTRLVQAETFEATYGGTEANVCAFLAQMGIATSFVTRLPQNPLGEAALWHLRRFGVGVEHIVFGGERLGVYFFERGVACRPGKVVYDRKYSSFATAKREDFPWGRILEDAVWFHTSGITPALGGELPAILCEALQVAKQRGLTTSLDVNYRETLWSPEEAQATLVPLLPCIDILIGNVSHLCRVFGVTEEEPLAIAASLAERYGIRTVVITRREGTSARVNRVSAMVYEKGEVYSEGPQEVEIVEGIGGGDCFTGGFIFGTLRGLPLKERLTFALAALCLKHTVLGDFGVLRFEEIERFAKGMVSSKIER
ncbi:MAG: sugar kinase [Atribacterota bacterium]